MAGLVGMEVPRRREQREPRHLARLACGQRHGERAAHAVAHHRRRAPAALADEGDRALQALDIGRHIERRSVVIGRAPVDEVGPQACAAMPRNRLFSAVRSSTSQRLISDGTTSTARAPRLRAARMRVAVIEQAGVALLPGGGRRLERALERMLAIGHHALGPGGPCAGRSRDGAPLRSGPRRPVQRLPQDLGDAFRCGRGGLRAGERASRAATRFRSSPRSSGPCPDGAAAVAVPRRGCGIGGSLGACITEASCAFAAAKRRAICSVRAWSAAKPGQLALPKIEITACQPVELGAVVLFRGHAAL